MKKTLFATLAALTLGGTLAGCYAHEDYDHDRAYHHHDDLYRDREGRVYRHERWHDQDVWQREDGRWYARQNNDWILRADVDIH
jgi:hypothetical protein